MSAPILVTGAAGFVGGHLLDALTAGPVDVVGWYRPGSAPTRQRTDVTWASVELLDRQAVIDSISDLRPSAIYHLAGSAHVGQSWQHTRETYEGNVLAMHHLFAALRHTAQSPRVLVTCSAHVYRPLDRPLRESDPIAPGSPYATSKLVQELLSRHAWEEDAIPALIARSFNHIGVGQDPSYVTSGIARQVARIEAGTQDPVLTLGNLEPKRDLTDVRDTVRAYVAMMERATPGVPYNVCSGRQLSIGEVVQAFVARATRDIRIVQDPSRFRPTDAPMLVGDPSRLSTDTDWTPEVPFEKTVDELLAYWRHRVQHEP